MIIIFFLCSPFLFSFSNSDYYQYLNNNGFFQDLKQNKTDKVFNEKQISFQKEPKKDFRESRIELFNNDNYKSSLPIHLNNINNDDKNYNLFENNQYKRNGKIIDRFDYFLRKGNKKIYSFEVGFKLTADNYLLVSSAFPSFFIQREMEFYSDVNYMPYLRFKFQDIKLSREKKIFLGNMFEINYINFNQQSPKFSSNGSFYKDGFVNIGTSIDNYSLFWRGDIFYKFSVLSFGGFFGLGATYITGQVLPFYFINYDEISQDDYNRYYNLNGFIVTAFDPVVIDEFGVAGKYGLSLNLDVKRFHFGIGLEYGISQQLKLYWITRFYYIEVGFKF